MEKADMGTEFSRRAALQTLVASGAIGALASYGVNASAQTSNFDSYVQSAKKNPWALGWRSALAPDLSTPEVKLVFGKIPKGLSGTLAHFTAMARLCSRGMGCALTTGLTVTAWCMPIISKAVKSPIEAAWCALGNIYAKKKPGGFWSPAWGQK